MALGSASVRQIGRRDHSPGILSFAVGADADERAGCIAATVTSWRTETRR